MGKKFYLVRLSDSAEVSVYCETSTLADALKAIHDNDLHSKGAFVEFCRGCYPSSYTVYKTMFAKGRCSA